MKYAVTQSSVTAKVDVNMQLLQYIVKICSKLIGSEVWLQCIMLEGNYCITNDFLTSDVY